MQQNCKSSTKNVYKVTECQQIIENISNYLLFHHFEMALCCSTNLGGTSFPSSSFYPLCMIPNDCFEIFVQYFRRFLPLLLNQHFKNLFPSRIIICVSCPIVGSLCVLFLLNHSTDTFLDFNFTRYGESVRIYLE